MSRELNPPREILRRFLFVLCMAGSLTAAIYLLVALAGRQPDRIFLGLLAVGANILLYVIGHHSYDFAGLVASFPLGEAESDIAREVRQELETVLRDIDDPDTTWMTRHELRKKLAGIIRKEPRLLELYDSEIRHAYPFFAGKPLGNDR